jgi:predicted transcriptional regulator
MNPDSRRQLTVLDAVHRDQHITQRHLSAKLGIALGLTNVYLKRLVSKGYIHCVTVPSNRLRYVITPKGMEERERLTYEFMAHSLGVYRNVRRHLSDALRSCRVESGDRIAVFGIGEAAELVYLSLKEKGLEPVAIFAHEGGGTFLGMRIRGLDEFSAVTFDRLLVATLDRPDELIEQLTEAGVSSDKLVTLEAMPAVKEGV